ncbi:proteasome adapter and scaffold protein ECM29-like [Styela clava]
MESTSVDKNQPAKMSENEQVELVFLKFGLAQSDLEFEALVERFLPTILGKVSSADENIRIKVMQLLNHISNRLKSRSDVKLPIDKLLQLYKESKSSFIVNFTIIYIKLGFPRLPVAEQAKLAPQLFAVLEDKPKIHQDALIRLLITTFPHIKLPDVPEKRKELFQFEKSPTTTKKLLEFCLDVILMPYSVIAAPEPSSRPSTAPVQGERSSPSTTTIVPPGLSLNAVKRLASDSSDSSWSIAQIEQFKVGILNLIGGDVFPESDIIILLIIASSDTRHTVSNPADLELKKRQRSLDWEDSSLNSMLYRLYLGEAQTLTAAQRRQKPNPASLRKPVELRIKLKIIQNLLRSQTSTERFPLTIQLTYDALFAKNTNARLRVLGLEYVHHICEKCELSKLLPQAPLLLNAMLKTTQGFENEPRTQGLGYTAMGKLARRVPDLFSTNLKLVQDAFQALSKEPSQELKLYIQESLAMMSQAYSKVSEDHLPLVEAVIAKYITDPDHLCRLSSVRYAGIIFSTDHVSSRYLLLLAASDVKEDVASEAKKLLYGSETSTETDKDDKKQNVKLPKFSEMLNFVYEKAQKRLKSSERFIIGIQHIAFPPSTFLVLLQYLRKCLLNDASIIGVNIKNLIPGDLSTEAPVISEYIENELKSNEQAMTNLISKYVELAMQFVKPVTDPNAVYILLEMFAICPDDFPVKSLLLGYRDSNETESYKKDEEEKLFNNRIEWLKNLSHHTRESIREYGAELYSIILRRLPVDETKQENLLTEILSHADSDKNFEKKHGSLLTLGYLLGEWIDNNDDMVPQVMKDALFCLAKNATSRDVAIASAACFSLSEIVRKTSLPITDGEVSSEENNEKDKDDEEQLIVSKDFTKSNLLTILLSHIKASSAHKLRERSVITLGCIPVGDPEFIHKEYLLNALLKSSEIKEADLHFTVARSLCDVALGSKSSAGKNHWKMKKDDNSAMDSSDTNDDKIPWLLNKILEEYVCHRIPAVRQAASIWLLTMLKTDEITSHSEIQQFLPKSQNAFMSLLTESDDLIQDIASKGLGVVYELGTEDQKKQLVDALVGSLMEGNASKTIKPNQDNLFQGAKGIGKAPDGSKLSTYKEICSLASDLNQPDLVYKFLHLAKHHALWNSKKGAAFGFSNIASLASEQLAPHLPRIVPRLYRYTFDPQPGVRSAMTSIWNALAPDPKKLVDKYLQAITDDLKKNLSSSIWRTRQASCLAVSDLLRGGRGIKGGEESDIIISALPELWTATLRVMDDIKETVRDAATVASKSLNKITIKLCEHDQGKLGEKAVEQILPVLLKEGLSSRVKEVKTLSLNTLVEVSKKSGKLIKSCIPQMVIALLEALSEFEPAMLNYLAVRSDQDGRQMLDLARAEAAKSSPMVETIDRVLQYADTETLKQLLPSLTDITKKNYGVMTKAGCSHVIISLVNHCPGELTQFASTILNAFVSGLGDNSLAVRKCNSEAIGHVVKVAKDGSVTKVLNKLKEWYLEKEDDIHRHASASACHAIGKHSPDVLRAHASVVLPLAFLGMHEMSADKNAKTDENAMEVSRKEDKNSSKYLWNDLWTEFTPGTASAIKLYIDELITFTSIALQSSQWKMKAQAAAAMAFLARQQKEGTIVGVLLHKLVEILLHGLQGRTWDGKEKLLTALCAVAVHCKSQLSVEEVSSILTIFFKECRRDKLTYKTESIHCLGAVLEAHRIDKFSLLWDIISPVLKKASGSDSDTDDDELGKNKKNISGVKLVLLENCIEACGRAWPHVVKTQDNHFSEVGKVLTEHITHSTWNIQLAALRATKLIFRTLFESRKTTYNMETNETGMKNGNSKELKVLDLEGTGLLDGICLSLGNAKYSRIREEALSLSQLLHQLIAANVFNSVGIDKLIHALTHSPLADKRSNKKTNVDELVKKFRPDDVSA